MSAKALGNAGEKLARKYLEHRGFDVARNGIEFTPESLRVLRGSGKFDPATVRNMTRSDFLVSRHGGSAKEVEVKATGDHKSSWSMSAKCFLAYPDDVFVGLIDDVNADYRMDDSILSLTMKELRAGKNFVVIFPSNGRGNNLDAIDALWRHVMPGVLPYKQGGPVPEKYSGDAYVPIDPVRQDLRPVPLSRRLIVRKK